MLARSREQKLATYIPYIIPTTGPKVTMPQQIAREFQRFYESLYNLKNAPPSQEQINSYLSSSHMPQLSTEASEALENPITVEEL